MSGGKSRLLCAPCSSRRGRWAKTGGAAPRPATACGRAARNAAALLMAGAGLGATAAQAQNATWRFDPPGNAFNSSGNWDGGQVPTGTATFGSSQTTSVVIAAPVSVQGFVFTPTAPAYTISTGLGGTSDSGGSLTFTGSGIENQSASQVTLTAKSGDAGGDIIFQGNSGSSGGSGTGTTRINVEASMNLVYKDQAQAGTRTIVDLRPASTLDISGLAPGSSTLVLGGLVSGSAGTLQLGSNTLSLQDNSSTSVVVDTVILGTGALHKSGSSTYILTGNGNTFSGGTTIAEGTLQIGNGGGTGTIGSGAIVNNAALAFNHSNNRSFSNNISGTGSLTKAGTNALTLTGTNSWSGTTTIEGGILQIGNGGTTGTLGSGAVSNSGTLTFNRSNDMTVVADISGTGNVVKQGAGTTTLTGTTSWSGTTSIQLGTLQIGDGNTAGMIGTGDVTMSTGTTLQFNRSDTLIVSANIHDTSNGTLKQSGTGTTILTGTNDHTHTIIERGTLQIGDGGTTGTLGTSAVQNNGTLAFNRSDDFNVAVQINGSGNVVKKGGGTVNLIASTSYTGTTTIESGTLSIGNGASLSGGGAIENAGTLQFNRSTNLTVANAISGTGEVKQVGTSITTLTGNNSYSGTTTITAGTLQIGNGGTAGTLGTGTVDNSGTLAFNRSNALTVANAISGTGNMSQIGGGTTTLTGNNSYTGTTTIHRGTLQIGDGNTSGTLGSGAVVTSGATTSGALAFNRSDEITVANAISGAGQVRQIGTSTLTLTGNNSYTGMTTIQSGTLQVGDGDISGTLGTGGVSNSGTLAFNRSDALTVRGGISGTGAVKQIGTGTTTLAGDSSYTGTTTIERGTLQIGEGNTTGSLGSGAVTNSGTLILNRSNALTVAAAIGGTGEVKQVGIGTTTLTGNNSYTGTTTITRGTLQIGSNGTTGTLGTGAVDNSGTLAFNRSNALTISAAIGGSGSVSQIGSGTTTLTSNNNYTGTTTIQRGTLQIGDGGTTGTLGTGAVTANGALRFARSNELTVHNDISGSGGVVQAGTGTTILTGTNSYTGGTFVTAGTLRLAAGASLASTGGLTVSGGTFDLGNTDRTVGTLSGTGGTIALGSGTLTTNASPSSSLATTITGSGGITKGGTGILTLSGMSTYSGTTTINGGTLVISDDRNLGDGGSLVFNGANTRLFVRANTTITTARDIGLNATGAVELETGTVFTANGNVTGTGGLTKAGAGTLVLAGTNNFSGQLTVSRGTVSIGSSANVGSSTISVGNGAIFETTGNLSLANSLIFDSGNGVLQVADNTELTVSSNISGNGGFSKSGAGLLTLTGTNSQLGGTRIDAGTVAVDRDANLGADNASLYIGGGTLRTTASFATGRSISLLDDNSGIDVSTGTLTLNGILSEEDAPGRLTKAGAGTLVLTAGNGYSGGTTVTGGLVNFSNANNFGSGAITLNGGGLQWASATATDISSRLAALGAGGGTFDTNGNNVTLASAITGAGALNKIGAGTLILTGSNDYSGGTTVSAGTLQGNAASLQGNIVNNASVVFDQATNGTYAGAMSGSGSLTKNGIGALTLSGNNSYAGTTTVSAGSLLINGDQSTATGLITVAAGATLGGNGIIGGSVTVANSAILAPGTSPGTLTINGDLTLGSSSILNFEFGQAGTAGGPLNDLVNVGNNLTLGGTLNVAASPGGAFDVGVYRIFNYGGALTNNGLAIGDAPVPTAGLSVQTSVAGQVNLVNTTGVTMNFWVGGSGVWNTGSGAAANWTDQDGTLTGPYTNSSFAVFQASPGTVTVANNLDQVVSAGMQFAADGYRVAGGPLTLVETTAATGKTIIRVGDGTAAGAGFTATIDSILQGSTQLVKADLGTLVLGGVNTYTGGTAITGGTLQVSSDDNLGAISGGLSLDGGTLRTTASFESARAVTLDGNGTFATDATTTLTLSGTIGGAGRLTKAGDGTLLLTGSNTYTGGTTVMEGTLQLGAGSSLAATGALAINGGTFDNGGNAVAVGALSGSGGSILLNGGSLATDSATDTTMATAIGGTGSFTKAGTGTLILTGSNNYSGGTTVSGGVLQGNTTSLQGGILNNAIVVFDQASTGTYAGAMTGSGSLTKSGAGTLILTGNNSYSGGTTVSAGILQGTTTSLQGDIVNNANVTFDQGSFGTYAGSMSGSGSLSKIGTGTLILTGNNSYAGGTTVSAGILQGNAASLQGNIVNGASVMFDQATNGTYAGAMSGSGNLSKIGGGTLTLTGTNSYTGATFVSAGSLLINGDQSAATGLTTVAPGATLGGNGIIGGSVEVAPGGTLAPGMSPGTLTINGDLTLSSGSSLAFEFGQAGASGGPLNDLVDVGNNLTLAGTLDVAVSAGGAFDPGVYRIFNYGGALTDNGLTIGTAPVPTADLAVQTSVAGQVNLVNSTDVTLNFWSGGSGVWNAGSGATANWTDESGAIPGPYTNNSFAVFQASPGTVTVANNLDQVVSAGMQFAADGYRIVGEALTLAETTAGTGAAIIRVGDGTAAGAVFTATVDNVLQGRTQLVKADLGTLILTGANTYAGGTAITGGTLQVSSDSNLGAASGGLSFTGGTLRTTASFSSGRAVTLDGNGTFATDAATTLTLSGAIGGAGGLTKSGGGTLILAGNNSYSGGTTVAAGILRGNSTSLQGNILNNAMVVFDQTGSGTYAGSMSGTGSMTLRGGGTLNVIGTNTYSGATTVDASTLVVNGSLASTVSVINGGILSGSGNIGAFVSNGGILAPGNSIGTMTINGNFIQNGGIYQVEVNAQGQNDKVNVSGTATINGATVQVLAQPGNYATSTTYTILTATGGISGAYTGVTSDYAFLTPSLAYDANNVFLTLALQGSTPFSGFGGNTPNQRAVGNALDRSYANASGDFATVIGALANLSTTQASPALNTISGQPYADFGSFNIANNALFMNALGQQMALARGGSGSGQRQALAQACDVAACDAASPFSVWGSVLGGVGSVQGNGNASTFSYNVGGAAAGIDYRLSPSFLVGLGAGYTNGTQWLQSFQGKGWSNSVSVAAYGSFAQWGFYLDALAGYGYSNNQMQRQISIPGLQPRTASGSTGANQFLGQVEAGYKLGIFAPAQATLTPFARFQASRINQAAFSEWGASSLSLNVAQQTTTSLRTVLGADLAGSIGLGEARTLDIGLRLGWLHEYANTARPMTAAFAGAPTSSFTVYGATPQRDAAVIGFQAGTEVATGTQLYLRYDGDIGSGTDNHALNLGLRLRW